jgi:branched-chain amino acid transport system permease protein
MVYLIIFVVVGGVETFWGPILGVIVMTIVLELSRPMEEWRPLIAGAILIFFLVVMPGGLEILLPKGLAILRKVPAFDRLLPRGSA